MSSRSTNERRRKEAAFARNGSLAVFILASILIAGSSFAFIGFTTAPMTTTAVVFAQEEDNNTANSTANNTTTTTTMTTNASSGIQLSSQPILQERTTTTSQTPINQTHISATFTGNGTLTLPNTNANVINFTTNGTALISLMTHSTQAKAAIMTEQGETATATFYDILKIDPATTGNGRGLTMAIIDTNSTGMLAPLNGTIVVGISNLQSNEANTVTLWEWESGIINNASDDTTSVQ
jgi:hypothetical protein